MELSLTEVVKALPEYAAKAQEIKESLLANLVMVGEIPAPTFKEIDRVEFLRQRFSEFDLENIRVDDVFNIEGTLPGHDSRKNILLVAHTDTLFQPEVSHTMAIHPNEVAGAGVCDNSMGVAALVTLPTFLDHLGVKLKSNRDAARRNPLHHAR